MNATEKTAIVRDYQRQANGFDNHHQNDLYRFTYSTGVKLVAETCGAYWLIDAISSYQAMRKVFNQPFQVWKLAKPLGTVGDDSWLLSCEDGNENVIVTQEIAYSDFPTELAPFSMWIEQNVLFLPEER